MLRFPQRRWIVLLGMVPLVLSAQETAPVPMPIAAEIRTPAAPPMPRINGPRVYGARPGHPFLYHLPTTGERPLTCTAAGLPTGLVMDPQTGNVTGVARESGTYPVEFIVTNARGTDKATIRFVIGDTICLTPPLGWNSWNHFARNVTAQNVRDAADAMVNSGLIDHGWTYINIDDCWQGERDAQGNILGNSRFPDLKAMGDYVHARGLKYGVYSSPGPQTCARFTGSYEHEDQDARTYADWGVDYVKYDLCTYSRIIRARLRARTVELLSADQRTAYLALGEAYDKLADNRQRTPEQEARRKETEAEMKQLTSSLDAARLQAFFVEEQQTPYRLFGQSLAKVSRDIAYSFCQYGVAESWEWAADLGGNCWRTTGDIQPNWKSMSSIGFRQDRLAKYARPGHWNDPDMLEIGNQGLDPDECYTHMTLWCMLSAPLLIGCDMSKMDPFTVSLFSNDEVLAINQDESGRPGYRLKTEGSAEVWVKALVNGSLAVALFNRGEKPAEIVVSMSELPPVDAARAASGARTVRDAWRQRELPIGETVKMTVAAHGAELLRVGP